MSYFSEMDWSAKWDWENIVGFGSKAMENPKKLHQLDWRIVENAGTNSGSFNLSGSGGDSGASGSDGGHLSSAKRSLSASTDSSTKDGIQTPNFTFKKLEGSPGNFSQKMEMKGTAVSGTSPLVENSVGSGEPLISVKLGKRIFFENSCGGGNVKGTSLSVMPTPSTNIQKKKKSSLESAVVPRCQVEGCNVNLSMAKEYHKKHRVCDSHSKCAKVIVAGVERRFCQQCSRFHGLSDFDDKKRSCRKKLSDHNARRRKQQQGAIFSSTRPSSPFYGERQEMNFPSNDALRPGNSTWNKSTCIFKFTLPEGYSFKSSGDGGSKQSVISSSHIDASAPKYGHALSLLSSNSWGSSGRTPVNNPLQENDTSITRPMMTAIPEGLPHEIWPAQRVATSSNIEDIQHRKTLYETDLYANIC